MNTRRLLSTLALAGIIACGADSMLAPYAVMTVWKSLDAIAANIDVTFPTRGQVRGGFAAKWLPSKQLCG